MEHKDKLKERRQKKLEALKQQGRRLPFEEEPPFPPYRQENRVYADFKSGSPTHPAGNSAQESSQQIREELEKWSDPEYVWEQKYRREFLSPSAYETGEGPRGPFFRKQMIKLAISTVLFASIWGLFQMQGPWAEKGREVIKTSLTQSFQFDVVAAWYQEKFDGAPSFLPTFRTSKQEAVKAISQEKRTFYVPVKGKIQLPFTEEHPGLAFQVPSGKSVSALDAGQVTYVGEKAETGLTVIIRHSGGVESTYGFLQKTAVELNDWIKGGENVGVLGEAEGEKPNFYFSMAKDGKPINPSDVMKFD
ncbi:hypothetical protein B7C51_05660 [Paenibacillus larvae subsp. pulvifaciens]|uniref:M23ase beta-sheet core domain-containing protein n=1 Tax=Paenibacillus larvae subsp. pulvifaciens TaxID=1477 RepID=A0A1V0UQK1_9BACL|nr:M23 family metallopeptidase [Paenibacillus larvae]ARF67421.1 hypothetical protein B7C51_05660 [Paenibacillus larvae subsp. pulvifaciens]